MKLYIAQVQVAEIKIKKKKKNDDYNRKLYMLDRYFITMPDILPSGTR